MASANGVPVARMCAQNRLISYVMKKKTALNFLTAFGPLTLQGSVFYVNSETNARRKSRPKEVPWDQVFKVYLAQY